MKGLGSVLTCIGLLGYTAQAQVMKDTLKMPEVHLMGYKSMNGVGHYNDYSGQVIYAGKKNEILFVDSLNANKALNNTRQIIGRVPGVNIIETEAGGFTANGIATRGLNPYQSIEMNTRQNGYNISADIFGYNEAYYLPPMEAVKSIQFLRGAAGLQFGPQIGGLVNYVLKDAPAKPFGMDLSQSFGSYGMSNSFVSAGGTTGKWQYEGFVQYRTLKGWRQNSDQQQLSGFGKVAYTASPKLKISLEYTLLRNKIHMPGGLTDSMFYENPEQSVRSRNWLTSPWNVFAGDLQFRIDEHTSLDWKASYQFSQRNLVWQNEDTWFPDFGKDSVGYPRELEREYFNNEVNEIRLLTKYAIGGREQTIAYGIRQSFSLMHRYEGGEGSTGPGLDLGLYGPYATAMHFKNNNLAAFAENNFHIGPRLSVTPGIRLEYLTTAENGIAENKDAATQDSTPELTINNQKSTRTFLLGGLGFQYTLSPSTNLYMNVSQSYRPVTYADLTPFGTNATVNPNLKDSRSVNGDFGFRGQVKNLLNFDVSTFLINYYDRIGTVGQNGAGGNTTYLVTNTGTDLHTGIESYGELNLSNLLFGGSKMGKLSVYNSFAYLNAVYTNGTYKGNQVEFAPHVMERAGINYWIRGFEINGQFSYQSKSFSDASNALSSPSGEIGLIPSYSVADVSAAYKWKTIKLSVGVNNLANEKYFTLRTSEYPGPGIIPSIGRMFYGGISVSL